MGVWSRSVVDQVCAAAWAKQDSRKYISEIMEMDWQITVPDVWFDEKSYLPSYIALTMSFFVTHRREFKNTHEQSEYFREYRKKLNKKYYWQGKNKTKLQNKPGYGRRIHENLP